MTLVAPGLSLRRLGYTMADLAQTCPRCRRVVVPTSNAYDRFTFGCGCGDAFSRVLADILAWRPIAHP